MRKEIERQIEETERLNEQFDEELYLDKQAVLEDDLKDYEGELWIVSEKLQSVRWMLENACSRNEDVLLMDLLQELQEQRADIRYIIDNIYDDLNSLTD